MVMPGDNITMEIELITTRRARRADALRHPRGRQDRRRRRRHQDPRVSEVSMADATKIRIRLKAFDHQLLDKSTTDIVETARRTGARVAGPIPLPTGDPPLHRAARTARRQEVARAVRGPHAQAPDRHPRADAADARRADEARPVGRRRRRDQELRSDHGKVDVYNLKREKVGELDLADEVFARRGEGAPLPRGRDGAARLAPRRHARRARSARPSAARRKKIYKQKGTGRARHGSIRAPIFVGGGRAHPPKPQDWSLPAAAPGAHRRAEERAQPAPQGRPPHRGRQHRPRRDQDQEARRRARGAEGRRRRRSSSTTSANENLRLSIRNWRTASSCRPRA